MSASDEQQARTAAEAMSDDEWQVYTTQEAAKAIGLWLEAGGRLDRPIHRLTLAELEGAAQAAISRWIVLSSIRLRRRPEARTELDWLLVG